MTELNKADNPSMLKICKICKGIFEANSGRQEYCCEECRSKGLKIRDNTRKHKARLKDKLEKQLSGKIPVKPRNITAEDRERRSLAMKEISNKLTSADRLEMARKAKVTRQENIAKGRLFKELVIERLMKEDKETGETKLEKMIESIVNKGIMEGDIRPFVALRDTIGEKPVEKSTTAHLVIPTFAPPPPKPLVIANAKEDPEYQEFLEWKKNKGIIDVEYE